MSIKILCPKCGKLASEQPSHVISYYDPRFNCRKCKHNKPLFFLNPKYKESK